MSSSLNPINIVFESNTLFRSQMSLPIDMVPSTHKPISHIRISILIKIEDSRHKNTSRSFLHGVTKLTPCKNGIVSNSSLYTKKRYIREFSTTINNPTNVISRIVPMDIPISKRHDLLRPRETIRIVQETLSLR